MDDRISKARADDEGHVRNPSRRRRRRRVLFPPLHECALGFFILVVVQISRVPSPAEDKHDNLLCGSLPCSKTLATISASYAETAISHKGK